MAQRTVMEESLELDLVSTDASMEETMKEERLEDEQNHDSDVNNIDPGAKQIKHENESTEIGAQIELYNDSHIDYIGNSALPLDIEKKGLDSDSIEPKSREALLLLRKPKEYSLEGESEKHEFDEEKASEHNSEEVGSPVEEDYCDNRAEDEFVGISGNSLDNNCDAKFENEKIDESDMDVQRLHSVADNNSNYVMANSEGYNHQNESNTLAEVENGDAVYMSESFGNRKLEISSDIDEMETKTLEEKEGFSTAEAAQEETLSSTSHQKAENALSPAEAPRPNSDAGSPLTPASARTGLPATEDELAPNAADKKIFLSSPRPSMHRHSPSQGNHNLSRKRASSRERTSPSIRCRTPPGMASGSRHRDHSHNKNSSSKRKEPALEHKPDFHRGDRSASDTHRGESNRKELSRSPRRRKSPSAWMSDPHQRDHSPRKHLSPSRRVESPRKKGRLASRSPLRKGVASGSKRDQRRRSRSKSPKDRDRYRRSPRRRYSPRRKSPVSGYPSRRHSPRRAWSPPANRSTGIGKPGRNLFVAGFSYITTERDLEKKFSHFGRVTDIRIVRDKRSGESRGFGFLSLERDEDADAAIRALDQTEWNGRIVLVEKSKTPVR